MSWQEKAVAYLQQCYNAEFDAEYEFYIGRSFCQVIGAALYGENADAEIDEKDDNKFGYSPEKTKHILKLQKVSSPLSC